MYILDRRKVPKTSDFVTASFPGKRACFFKPVIRRPAGGYIPALHVLLILNVVLPQQNLSNPLDATVASSIHTSPYVLGEIPPKKSQHAQLPHRWYRRRTIGPDARAKRTCFFGRPSRIAWSTPRFALEREGLALDGCSSRYPELYARQMVDLCTATRAGSNRCSCSRDKRAWWQYRP